jgi:hypothetical protein
MARRRRSQLGRLGKWVKVQPLGKCDFIGYHGTYRLRAGLIRKEGLRVAGRGIWFTTNPAYAYQHIAKRAVMEGCPEEPITVLKIRVLGREDRCPVWKPLKAHSLPDFYMTSEPIPKSRILSEVPPNQPAIKRGRDAGFKRLKKVKKPRPIACPPPVELQGRRGRRR